MIHDENPIVMTNYFQRIPLFILITVAAVSFAFAQTAKSVAPRQEKLLNGLKLLVWSDPSAAKATVKLRVHSGAAFDTQTREGTMALLGEVLFPNASVNEFFSEELGGSLNVESNYDYIQITATGNADKILTILETVATAVTKPTIDKETVGKVRSARLEKIKELEKNPTYAADLAVARRLFGAYPYGRSAEGTAESLTKIDFADVLLAKQRFLTADNATVAISGNIKSDYVFKAVRQLFGGWEKADKKVPATFAQPNAPAPEIARVAVGDLEKSFVRRAAVGVARNSRDYLSAMVLAKVWNARLNQLPNGFARSESRLLRGMLVWGTSFDDEKTATGNDLFKSPKEISADEFGKAKNDLQSELNRKNTEERWLDVDTFKLASVKDETQRLNDLTVAEVNQFAAKLQPEPFVTILFERK